MNPILYGKDKTERIVGAYDLDDKRIVVLTRTEDDNVEAHEKRVYPYFWTTDRGYAEIKGRESHHKELNGKGPYRHLVVTDQKKDWQALREDSEDNYFQYSLTEQYFTAEGLTMFKGMTLNDLHRLQFDIETTTEHEFPNSERPEDEVIIISMSDNRGWRKVLHTGPSDFDDCVQKGSISEQTNSELPCNSESGIYESFESEDWMLYEFLRYIHRRDPDTLEGHNIFGFDLPYLRDRFEMHELNFALGRDSRPPRTYTSKMKFADLQMEYEVFDVAGRHVIDSFFLAKGYDVFKRGFKNFRLKYLADHFGVSAPDREYVEGHKIPQVWKDDPKRLLKYALDDVIETEAIVSILAQAQFALTQMLPFSFSKVHRSGSAAIIESMFVREYFRKRQALPKPEDGKQEWGGYTDIFRSGVYKRQAYLDVASLYPTIMLNYEIQPERDDLRLFQELLTLLTDLRLVTKKEMNDVGKDMSESSKATLGQDNQNQKSDFDGSDTYDTLDAKQSAYKVLINSFYGATGFSFAIFNDFSEADRVARNGQRILKMIIKVIEHLGGKITLVDTDGVLCTLPDGMTADEVAEYVTCSMPKGRGIIVENDGEFPRVLSYKKKNYVLDTGSEIKLKGNSLKGRGMEPFARKYLLGILKALLDEDVERVGKIHRHFIAAINEMRVPIEDLARSANLKKSIKEYEKGLDEPNKNPMARYEMMKVLDERGEDVFVGDKVKFYVGGKEKRSNVKVSRDARLLQDYKMGDENPQYYLKRIDDIAKRFEVFFTPEDFGKVFVRTLEYIKGIDYDYANVQITNKEVSGE